MGNPIGTISGGLEEKVFDDQQKLKSVFNRYYRPLALFANGFIPNISECEDVVQEVFVFLWKSKLSFPNEKALRSYLYKTVKNKCYNILKHEKVKRNYADQYLLIFEDEESVKQLEIKSEVVSLLHRSITKLPDRQQEAIKWTLKGLRNNEIAERMHIQLQTVKTLKSQAYAHLRRFFMENPT